MKRRSSIICLGLSLLTTLTANCPAQEVSPAWTHQGVKVGQAATLPSAEAYANLAGEQFSQGKYNEAIQSASECLRLDPRVFDCNFVRGLAYYATSKYDEAILDLTVYLQAQPTNPQAFAARAECYLEKGNYTAALADLDAALALESNSETLQRRDAIKTEYYLNLALDQLNEGKIDESIASATEGLKLDKNRPTGYQIRASAHYANQNLDAAIGDLSQYILLRPDDTQGYAQRGGIYLEEKDYDAAIADLSKALEIRYDNDVRQRLDLAKRMKEAQVAK